MYTVSFEWFLKFKSSHIFDRKLASINEFILFVLIYRVFTLSNCRLIPSRHVYISFFHLFNANKERGRLDLSFILTEMLSMMKENWMQESINPIYWTYFNILATIARHYEILWMTLIYTLQFHSHNIYTTFQSWSMTILHI